MKEKKSLIKPFYSFFSNMALENKMLKFGMLCLCVVVVYQQHSLNKAISDQKVIIVPPHMMGEAQVGTNYADVEYMRSIAAYIGFMYLDVNAANIDSQYSRLLGLVNPSNYSSLRDKLKKRSELIKRYGAISYNASLLKESEVKLTSKSIRINFSVKRVVGSNIESNSPTTLKVDYEMNNGMFQIKDINEVKYTND